MDDRQRSLLVIEDDPDFREVLARRFIRRGFSIVAVDGIASAREVLAARTFDVVLLDRGLNGRDGLGFVRELKPLAPTMQVIVLSGHVDEASLARAESLEVFAYLVKPCSLQKLEETIVAACQKRLTSTAPEKG